MCLLRVLQRRIGVRLWEYCPCSQYFVVLYCALANTEHIPWFDTAHTASAPALVFGETGRNEIEKGPRNQTLAWRSDWKPENSRDEGPGWENKLRWSTRLRLTKESQNRPEIDCETVKQYRQSLSSLWEFRACHVWEGGWTPYVRNIEHEKWLWRVRRLTQLYLAFIVASETADTITPGIHPSSGL